MKTEYELRVLEINREEIEKKLISLGAKKTLDVFQKRYVYDFHPVEDKRWIRLRTDGNKTTLTIKDIRSDAIDGTKELEIEVSDFEDTNKIMETLGYFNRGFQENKRVQYILNDVEIDFDRWPLVPEYMEIEGKSEDDIYKTLDILGIPKEQTTTLDVEGIYAHYGISSEHLNDLSFEMEEK